MLIRPLAFKKATLLRQTALKTVESQLRRDTEFV